MDLFNHRLRLHADPSRVVVRPFHIGWLANGSGISRSQRLINEVLEMDAKQARDESAPLAALCFIEKSPEHRLTPIRPAEALRRLLEAASIPWFSSALRDRVLPLVERLVSTVPAYRLGFHPDPGVIDCLLPLVGAAPSS